MSSHVPVSDIVSRAGCTFSCARAQLARTVRTLPPSRRLCASLLIHLLLPHLRRLLLACRCRCGCSVVALPSLNPIFSSSHTARPVPRLSRPLFSFSLSLARAACLSCFPADAFGLRRRSRTPRSRLTTPSAVGAAHRSEGREWRATLGVE